MKVIEIYKNFSYITEYQYLVKQSMELEPTGGIHYKD